MEIGIEMRGTEKDPVTSNTVLYSYLTYAKLGKYEVQYTGSQVIAS